MRTRVIPFLPAIFAALTGVAVKIFFELYLRQHQQGQAYPEQLVIYQFGMFAVALLMAFPVRLVWIPAVFVLLGGVILAGFSVGLMYLPTVAVAGWVAVRQFEATPVEPRA